MAQAVFIAGDPNRRAESENKLQERVAAMRGVIAWSVDAGGHVTVDNRQDQTSSNVIEEPLAGIGYRIERVEDSRRVGNADAPNLGVNEKRDGGTKYG